MKNNFLKKRLTVLMVGFSLFGLTACGVNSNNETSQSKDNIASYIEDISKGKTGVFPPKLEGQLTPSGHFITVDNFRHVSTDSNRYNRVYFDVSVYLDPESIMSVDDRLSQGMPPEFTADSIKSEGSTNHYGIGSNGIGEFDYGTIRFPANDYVIKQIRYFDYKYDTESYDLDIQLGYISTNIVSTTVNSEDIKELTKEEFILESYNQLIEEYSLSQKSKLSVFKNIEVNGKEFYKVDDKYKYRVELRNNSSDDFEINRIKTSVDLNSGINVKLTGIAQENVTIPANGTVGIDVEFDRDGGEEADIEDITEGIFGIFVDVEGSGEFDLEDEAYVLMKLNSK